MADIECLVNGKEFRLAVDAIVLWQGKLVLIKRKYPPFKGFWALPGGMVDLDETMEQAAIREVHEETGIDCEVVKLVGAFSALKRDPRCRSVAICYSCKARNSPLKRTEEAEEVKLFPLDKLPKLAFDHHNMVSTFLCAAREQSTYPKEPPVESSR